MRDPGDPGVLGIESYVPPPQNTLPLIEPFVRGSTPALDLKRVRLVGFSETFPVV